MFLVTIIIVFPLFGSNLATESPIIGILSQETYIVHKYLPEKYDSFIAASYVKLLESAGARIVPVWIGQNNDYYSRIVNNTNGILFPGGGTYFNESGGYGEAAKKIFNFAVNLNKNGVYYPIWGICLGMQVLGFAEAGIDLRTDCYLKRISVPLEFREGFQNCKLFSDAPEHIIDTFRTQNVTYNLHRYCLTESTMKEHDILNEWNILSTNEDQHGQTFISSMEHKKYPIYGIQFHPERNAFEFKKNVGVSHSAAGIKAMQYLANFFVEECRKNDNSFMDFQTELNSLIYNYNPIYTGKKNSSYEQVYAFEKTDYENKSYPENMI